MTVNLRDLAREVSATSKSVEYEDIANQVLARLEPEEYAEALAQALPLYVRAMAVRGRTLGPMPAPPAPTSESWKVREIREDWQHRLLEIYATPDGNKRLGDLTYSDLLHLAEARRQSAEQLVGKAKGWENLARVVRKQRVSKVRELTPEILNANLGAVA